MSALVLSGQYCSGRPRQKATPKGHGLCLPSLLTSNCWRWRWTPLLTLTFVPVLTRNTINITINKQGAGAAGPAEGDPKAVGLVSLMEAGEWAEGRLTALDREGAQ